MLSRKIGIPTLFYNSSFPLQKEAVQKSSPGPKVAALLLVLILDQAQFVLQALAVAQ